MGSRKTKKKHTNTPHPKTIHQRNNQTGIPAGLWVIASILPRGQRFESTPVPGAEEIRDHPRCPTTMTPACPDDAGPTPMMIPRWRAMPTAMQNSTKSWSRDCCVVVVGRRFRVLLGLELPAT